ncbi:efflux transporter outer membrane subunit [Variovorax sp. PAMC 28711]|uniref:efflux transporter outer membrane subunit n=1 Tax=Variovorax sp. PAMC 28711 TaxID=1795631 RepID=UPI00078D6310|nr:efflux transporter outer membrane subunit [Variovorax sp. PAMC 28711]AMM24979.1 transporter [Variovorax sp. PAMC 28711]
MTRIESPSFRPVPLACSLVALACLAGCINLAPDYARPAAPVPAAWQSRSDAVAPAAAGEATALDTRWQDFFTDDKLRRTVALALESNRDLRVAALNIERARAEYGITRSALFPVIDAGAGGSRSRTPGSLSTSGASRVASQYSADLGLTSYELDLFGRVRNLGESALQSYLGTEESRRSTQISLVASVATAWLQLAADEQRLQLARNTLESQRKSYDLIERSHALGAQSGLALAQSQSTVDAARADAAAFDSLVEQDRNALTLLVGTLPPDDLLPQGGTVAAAAPVARLLAPPADLPSSVLQQRPDVLAAERALQASNADIGAARAAFFPRIALTASAGTASSSLSGLFKSGSKAWSFAPSVSVPIFDGGFNRANLRVAEAQQQIQLANYEKTLQTAFREVADALAERRTMAERLSAQQSLLAASARSFELSQALFRSGRAGYLDVLDAQRSLYSAQQTLIGLQLTEQANRLVIYKVLGGGWSASAPETAARPAG